MGTKESGSCPLQSHQEGDDPVAKENHHTDAAAKQATRGQPPEKPKVLLAPEMSAAPRYSPEKED